MIVNDEHVPSTAILQRTQTSLDASQPICSIHITSIGVVTSQWNLGVCQANEQEMQTSFNDLSALLLVQEG